MCPAICYTLRRNTARTMLHDDVTVRCIDTTENDKKHFFIEKISNPIILIKTETMLSLQHFTARQLVSHNIVFMHCKLQLCFEVVLQ